MTKNEKILKRALDMACGLVANNLLGDCDANCPADIGGKIMGCQIGEPKYHTCKTGIIRYFTRKAMEKIK